MIQVFCTKKCNDTKKAERFFKERNNHYHGGSSLSRLTDGNIPDHKAGIGVNKTYKSDFL